MSTECLSGDKLHKAIMEAQERGDGPDVFEVELQENVWYKGIGWDWLICEDNFGSRIKLRKEKQQ